jgi:hypothetical protein
MIIWRGAGILAVIFLVVGAAIGFTVIPDQGTAVALLIGGAASAGMGYWLNGPRAAAETAAVIEARRRELDRLVETGAYRPSTLGAAGRSGYQVPAVGPMPRSLDEARSMAAAQFAAESAYLTKERRNPHTLFFIPMQIVGYLMLGLGGLMAVASLVTR